jgi:hypothetical protein
MRVNARFIVRRLLEGNTVCAACAKAANIVSPPETSHGLCKRHAIQQYAVLIGGSRTDEDRAAALAAAQRVRAQPESDFSPDMSKKPSLPESAEDEDGPIVKHFLGKPADEQDMNGRVERFLDKLETDSIDPKRVICLKIFDTDDGAFLVVAFVEQSNLVFFDKYYDFEHAKKLTFEIQKHLPHICIYDRVHNRSYAGNMPADKLRVKLANDWGADGI